MTAPAAIAPISRAELPEPDADWAVALLEEAAEAGGCGASAGTPTRSRILFSFAPPVMDSGAVPTLEVILVNNSLPDSATNDSANYLAERTQQGSGNSPDGQTRRPQSGNAAELDPSEAHVHFEVEENGRRVDPATWLNSAIASNATASTAPAAPSTPAAQPARRAKRAPATSKKK